MKIILISILAAAVLLLKPASSQAFGSTIYFCDLSGNGVHGQAGWFGPDAEAGSFEWNMARQACLAEGGRWINLSGPVFVISAN